MKLLPTPTLTEMKNRLDAALVAVRDAVVSALHHFWEAIMFFHRRDIQSKYTHSAFWAHMGVFLAYVIATFLFGFIPTVAIGFLAVVAVIMTVRDEQIRTSQGEKVIWLLLTFAFLIIEVVIAHVEHDHQIDVLTKQDDSFSRMLSQGQLLLAQERKNFQINSETLVLLRSLRENEKQKGELQVLLNRNQPKAQAEAAKTENLPRIDLKRMVSELSADIYSFLAARKEAEPPSPSTPNSREALEKYFAALPGHLEQTMTLYDQSFTKRVKAIHETLAKQGIRDDQLDEYYKDPTNKFGIETVANRLVVIAERLKQ